MEGWPPPFHGKIHGGCPWCLALAPHQRSPGTSDRRDPMWTVPGAEESTTQIDTNCRCHGILGNTGSLIVKCIILQALTHLSLWGPMILQSLNIAGMLWEWMWRCLPSPTKQFSEFWMIQAAEWKPFSWERLTWTLSHHYHLVIKCW